MEFWAIYGAELGAGFFSSVCRSLGGEGMIGKSGQRAG